MAAADGPWWLRALEYLGGVPRRRRCRAAGDHADRRHPTRAGRRRRAQPRSGHRGRVRRRHRRIGGPPSVASGPAGMTDADRRWARALLAGFRGLTRWPVHLATRDRVQVFAPDDLIAAWTGTRAFR